MNIMELGAIGELVGGVAVLATLFYLAVQIRQNTQTVRTSTYQSVLEASNRVNELVLANPNLERIYRLGRRDLGQLDEDEQPLFQLLIRQYLNIYETMFLQYERGILDGDFWEARRFTLRVLLSRPGVRAHLLARREQRQAGRVATFQNLVDSFLNEIPSDPS